MMLTQSQAVAIILEYDTVPVSLLTKNQKAALAAAKDVNQDAASRAVAEFLGHESSKKYISPLPVTTLVEFHD